MERDSLGDRMKGYENVTRLYLDKKVPVIIRIDGKAFHTFTKGCKKPYDDRIINAMKATTEFLMKNIQGAKVGYVQSDEISILITDYDREETSAWFEYNVQKMVSVAASMAAVNFTLQYDIQLCSEEDDFEHTPFYANTIKRAYFDARVANYPKDEIINYFRWRFQDCTRNSMSMLAQSLYSQKELNGKKWVEQSVMCEEKGQDWFKLDPVYRYGTCYFWNETVSDDGKILVAGPMDISSREECGVIFGRYI